MFSIVAPQHFISRNEWTLNEPGAALCNWGLNPNRQDLNSESRALITALQCWQRLNDSIAWLICCVATEGVTKYCLFFVSKVQGCCASLLGCVSKEASRVWRYLLVHCKVPQLRSTGRLLRGWRHWNLHKQRFWRGLRQCSLACLRLSRVGIIVIFIEGLLKPQNTCRNFHLANFCIRDEQRWLVAIWYDISNSSSSSVTSFVVLSKI